MVGGTVSGQLPAICRFGVATADEPGDLADEPGDVTPADQPEDVTPAGQSGDVTLADEPGDCLSAQVPSPQSALALPACSRCRPARRHDIYIDVRV